MEMVRGFGVRRFGVLLQLAVALPGVIVALLTGVSGVFALVADRPLLLAPVPRNVAEAAGNRDVADVVVMAPSSEMNQAMPARIPLRMRNQATLTPLEAAVISERAYMIRVVHDHGARLGPVELRTLRCLAQARRDRGTIDYLNALDSGPLDCAGVKLP
jgi:hypothetical protein